ncbi:FecR family protein [Sphingobacterium composti Ten et al. 2007 non Yoo et al. 2007]|uniref:FecR family protein n=1 Tax=Sphingobacterium composti TaxID=363260 RepID=UPI00135C9B9D|nr:FecR family protein [Sphingobacterium composti Ten et al. 2007 non Yoo et al. 2007]
MDNKQKIEELVNKFNSGEISSKEYQELLSWYNSFDDTSVLISVMEENSTEALKSKIFNRIKDKTYPKIKSKQTIFEKRKSTLVRLRWVACTAIAATVLLNIGFWLFTKQAKQNLYLATPQQIEQLIPAGGNKAKLILSNGKEIDLDQNEGEIIIGDNITYSSGELITTEQNNQIITLEVPKGGKYQVTLPDGSQVWLNSGSKLTYPSSFAPGQSRIVKLQGEAYFKVNKLLTQAGERIPFIVRSDRQNIKVLGTEFNISDYQEFTYSHTTLVEGKVSVGASMLLPSEQYIIQGGKSAIRHVNPSSYYAWKEGKFDFDDKPLSTILDEISLWYDIKVVYENKIPQVELSGQAYRQNNFNLILRLLEVAKVEYKLDLTKRELIIK